MLFTFNSPLPNNHFSLISLNNKNKLDVFFSAINILSQYHSVCSSQGIYCSIYNNLHIHEMSKT